MKHWGWIAVPLKYLSNLWRSLKMSLNQNWTNHCVLYCVLSANGNDNNNANTHYIYFLSG